MNGFPSGFAVIDVETTGLSAQTDRVLEIAVVRTDAHGEVLGELSTLVNARRPPAQTRVHGITAADLEGAPFFEDLLGELAYWLGGAVLVGHNVTFDIGFLRAELYRAGVMLPSVAMVCTQALAYQHMPYLESHRLPSCCAAIGYQHDDHHTALGDARAARALLLHFGRKVAARSGGIPWTKEMAHAASLQWPSSYPRAARLLPRRTRGELRAEEEAILSRLLAELPADGGNGDVGPYLQELDAALEERRLLQDKAQAVFALARAQGLTAGDVVTAHRAYLAGVARLGLGGAIPGDVAAEDLAQVGRLLGLPDAERARALAAAQADGPLPLPGEGRPLRLGMTVCFSGDGQPTKAELTAAARAAGLRVVTAMSRKVDVLVVRDPYTSTSKIQQARAQGTRSLAVPVFLSLLPRCAEALEKPAPVRKSRRTTV
jgi:DNA polymerase-3 subunit epsilon